MSTKILNQSQAEAVYSAMCALNNVGGAVNMITLDGGRVIVCTTNDAVEISARVTPVCATGGNFASFPSVAQREEHADQSAFATAYGLQDDEDPGSYFTNPANAADAAALL